jgi:hypothetical protein
VAEVHSGLEKLFHRKVTHLSSFSVFSLRTLDAPESVPLPSLLPPSPGADTAGGIRVRAYLIFNFYHNLARHAREKQGGKPPCGRLIEKFGPHVMGWIFLETVLFGAKNFKILRIQ